MQHYTTLSIYTGYVLSKIREAMGFKQQRVFAKFLGMSHTGLGKIERGETGTTVDHLYMMAGIIGNKPDEILRCVNLVIEDANRNFENITVLSSSDFNKIEKENLQDISILDTDRLEEIISTETQIEILKIITVKISEKQILEAEEQIRELEKIKELEKTKSLSTVANSNEELSDAEAAVAGAVVGAAIGAVLGAPIGAIAAVGLGLFVSKRSNVKKAP